MTRGGRFPDHLTFAEPPTASAHRKKTESLRFPEASRAGRTSRRPPPCTSRSSTSSPLLGFDQTRDDDEREARERGHGARAGRGQARWADVGRAGDDRESYIISSLDVQLVQNLVERCLQLYMNQREVVTLLQQQTKIQPQLHVAGVAEARGAEIPNLSRRVSRKLFIFTFFCRLETRDVSRASARFVRLRLTLPLTFDLERAHQLSRTPAGVLRAPSPEGPDLHLQPDARAAAAKRARGFRVAGEDAVRRRRRASRSSTAPGDASRRPFRRPTTRSTAIRPLEAGRVDRRAAVDVGVRWLEESDGPAAAVCSAHSTATQQARAGCGAGRGPAAASSGSCPRSRCTRRTPGLSDSRGPSDLSDL